MEHKRDFIKQWPAARVVLFITIVAIGLSLAGCNRQMARIDENQIKLQAMVEANAQQIADIATRLEQNRQELHVVIKEVKTDVAKVAVDVAAVADAQSKLQRTVQTTSQTVANDVAALNRQFTSEIATLRQNQEDMSASLSGAIVDAKNETHKVAADVATVTAEQAKFHETILQNNAELSDKVAAMETSQQERQDTIGGMQDNIQAVASSITALGEDVLRLQEILQNNIRELVTIADTTGQKQAEFQQSIIADLKSLDDSLASLRANQSELQSRIEQMQSNTPDLSDVPAALDQLRDQLEELARTSAAHEAATFEYESTGDVSTTDTNSIE